MLHASRPLARRFLISSGAPKVIESELRHSQPCPNPLTSRRNFDFDLAVENSTSFCFLQKSIFKIPNDI
jgi:hypothetical protein